MSLETLIGGAVFIVSMLLTILLFLSFLKVEYLRERLLVNILSVYFSAAVITATTIYLFWYPYDLIGNNDILSYLSPLLFGILIIIGLFIDRPYICGILALAACSGSVFASGNYLNLFPQILPLYNQLITIVLYWGFTMGWKVLSGLNPMPQIEGLTASGGIIALYLLGAAPIMMYYGAAGIFGAFVISYFYSRFSPIGLDTAVLSGYLIGWLGLQSAVEYLLPCFVVFCMFYLIELAVGISRKLSFLPQYKEFGYDSVSVTVFNNGCPASFILHNRWNNTILLLIFGSLQIYSHNPLSMPLFAGIMMIWQVYRLSQWQTPSKTFKESSQELISDIKTTFGQIFSSNKTHHKDEE